MLRKSKSILAMLLVVLTCATAITPVFATEGPEEPEPKGGPIIAKDQDNPVEAAITKKFRLPEGTAIPNVEFIFKMEGISIDGNKARGKDAPVPDKEDLTLSFPSNDAVSITDSETGIITLRLETKDIFANVDFPGAGEYVYEITEANDSNSAIEDNKNEWLNYSEAKYTLHVLVANKEGDEGGLYIRAIGTIFTTDHDGTDVDGEEKVDATPGGGLGFDYSQMIFVNDYIRLNDEEKPDDPDPTVYSTLFASKAVSGIYASQSDYFDFEMTINVPSIMDPLHILPYYRAYIVEGANVVTGDYDFDASLIGSDDHGVYIKVSTGDTIDFSLKHGQRLVFVDTPIGTRYEVKEFGDSNYLASYIVTTNGVAAAKVPADERGEDLSTGIQHTGLKNNSAAFTNARHEITPTGLNIKDLPFFVLIALGLGTLFTYVVVTVNKRKQYNQ